jgi:hypothetical protein
VLPDIAAMTERRAPPLVHLRVTRPHCRGRSLLLAGSSAAKSFLDRTQHCTEAQLEAAEFALGASKFESDLPG